MGSYCMAKGFYRKKEGIGGSRIKPEPILSSDVFCEKCKIAVNKILITHKSSRNATERGILITSWDVVNIKCPKCKRTGVCEENEKEEDGSYYPNEERRVYRKY